LWSALVKITIDDIEHDADKLSDQAKISLGRVQELQREVSELQFIIQSYIENIKTELESEE
jgi:hypothetical protein